MKNIKLVLEFDGSNFNGFQIQDGARTVQGVMEDALSKLLNEDIRVRGCSRTDAGVHSLAYVLNFKTKTTIPGDKIIYPLNIILPEDIKVKKSQEVPLDFDSRLDAKTKIYSYSFLNSKVEPVIFRNILPLEKAKLNFKAMEEGSKLFIGRHDFKAFMSMGSEVKSTIRTIFDIGLKKDNDVITITIEGDGFLYNMVRIIAGTLIFLGQGTRTIEDIKEALEKGDRLKAGKVAKAKGLTLVEVKY